MPQKKYTPEELMQLSIDEMKKSVPDYSRGDKKINPKVGAVLATKDGHLIGTAHRGELRDGDHAEFTLLERKKRSENLTGAVLYATLEPCAPGARNHPKLSCAERIFNARISKVYIGYIDPDPTVAGEGRDFLKSKDIEVDYYPKHLQDQIYGENKQFFDQAEIRAKEHNEKELAPPLKPFEHPILNYEISSLSEEAQNEMILRMSLPYKLHTQGFHQYLDKLSLIAKYGSTETEEYRPTGLGLLLLGQTPQLEYPQSRIKFTLERENVDSYIHEIEGPLLLMPQKVEDYLDAAFLTEINRDNFHREELTSIPKKLLRELIINAIVHRDYLIEGSQIKVIANADKIEIWSPGEPLFSIDRFKTYDVPSQSKNPKIAYLFFKTKLIEERNIGMKELKAFKKSNSVIEPSFRMEGPYFVITIYRKAVDISNFVLTESEKSDPVLSKLSKPQILFYRYIAQNGPISSSDYSKVVGITDRSVRRYYNGMEELLEKEGSGPNIKFVLKKK